MGLNLYQTFIYAVVHFGDVPAECVARVVGHDQTILLERPLEVAPHAPAIQADFSESGDRLLNRKGISSVIVSIPFYKLFTEKSLKKSLLQYQKRKVRRWTHAQRSCAANKETLTTRSSWSSTRRRSAKSVKTTVQGKRLSAHVE